MIRSIGTKKVTAIAAAVNKTITGLPLRGHYSAASVRNVDVISRKASRNRGLSFWFTANSRAMTEP